MQDVVRILLGLLVRRQLVSEIKARGCSTNSKLSISTQMPVKLVAFEGKFEEATALRRNKQHDYIHLARKGVIHIRHDAKDAEFDSIISV